MSKLEKQEEKIIKEWCKDNGVLFIKFTPLGEKGWPDRIAVFPGGLHAWVELKRNGEHPSKLQHHRMQTLADMGCIVEWFDSAEGCIEMFEEMLAAAKEVVDPAPKIIIDELAEMRHDQRARVAE